MFTKLSPIINFYIYGFRNMSKLGRKLWLIIAIKLFIFFVVIKMLFFPDILQEKFHSDKERADYVMKNLLGGEK
ncbi:DUF4492 domain-containing protein [Nitratiruptor sp. SB155-2]|uniref:DUF4492 domain-containing protein n=1 Tax=Nitratiruptor sp. (strain SB155-2) TaxID=387092 RepID=UPI0001586F3B|nr:DUF4492 domain-containing protein [Nitratiruptor sp. SB155-2]BAF69262.1 conserved hypothetical protein [Nitratiruptor sp. SB155-2]